MIFEIVAFQRVESFVGVMTDIAAKPFAFALFQHVQLFIDGKIIFAGHEFRLFPLLFGDCR